MILDVNVHRPWCLAHPGSRTIWNGVTWICATMNCKSRPYGASRKHTMSVQLRSQRPLPDGGTAKAVVWR